MRLLTLAALMVARAAPLAAQQPQGASPAAAFEVDLANARWTNPSKADSSAQYAILRSDSISGTTQLLWRFRPNAKGPCEWHGANQSIVVVQGSVVVRRVGMDGATLGVGGFAFMPRTTRFQLTVGSEPTIIMSTLDGRPDFNVAPDSECTGQAISLEG